MSLIDIVMKPLPSSLILTSFISCSLLPTASADLLIYEPFDYAPTAPPNNEASLGDGNQAGGLGLGEWSQLNTGQNEADVAEIGLSFTDGQGNVLEGVGNSFERASRVGQAAVSSPIDPAATAGLTADGTTIWMTFLFQDRGFSGPDFGIGLATENMVGDDNQGLVAPGYGVGFGITSTGGQSRNIHTVIYNDSVNFDRVPEATPTFNGPGNSPITYLAMKVNWNPSGTPDEIFVFNLSDDFTTEPDEADALASDTFDFDLATQQSLDVFNISDTQVAYVDEIRVATTYAEAVGLVAPAGEVTLNIAVNATTPGTFDFSWNGEEGKVYDLVSSTDLATSPSTWEVWDDRENVSGSSLVAVPGDGSTRRFFAIIAK
jgi:hypothetical protein